jgi:cytidylate kinase
MYRAAALAVLRAGLAVDPPEEDKVDGLLGSLRLELDDEGSVLLDGERVDKAIREEPVDRAVSAVAALGSVRRRMVDLQRSFAERGNLVVEGRDLGTVVFPDAPFRFYVDADPAVRARRRSRQSSSEGWGSGSESEVLRDQEDRDRRDSERALSPLLKGKGVVVIDTTEMTVEEVVQAVLRRIWNKENSTA